MRNGGDRRGHVAGRHGKRRRQRPWAHRRRAGNGRDALRRSKATGASQAGGGDGLKISTALTFGSLFSHEILQSAGQRDGGRIPSPPFRAGMRAALGAKSPLINAETRPVLVFRWSYIYRVFAGLGTISCVQSWNPLTIQEYIFRTVPVSVVRRPIALNDRPSSRYTT